MDRVVVYSSIQSRSDHRAVMIDMFDYRWVSHRETWEVEEAVEEGLTEVEEDLDSLQHLTDSNLVSIITSSTHNDSDFCLKIRPLMSNNSGFTCHF